jgi:FADH2 O2-dependent halogenase
MRPTSSPTHDVIVLGTGMAGTTIAAVLARHGAKVLMLERHAHPRFAIGESMLPQAALWLWMLARRFDVDQIGHLSHLDAIMAHVSPRSGLERTFGFAYHHNGRTADPAQTHKLIPPNLPFVQEAHLLREDSDHYLLDAAIQHGAAYRDHAVVDTIDVDDHGVTVRLDDGTTYRGRYLLDGAGYRSQLATRFGLRDDPTRLRTRSRTIFTHVDGMPPFDDIIDTAGLPAGSQRFHEGTLHHVFDGGWFWIIPFGNHSGASNATTSVGLTLDLDRFPVNDLPADEEFAKIVARFPTVARHFRDATATRPFVKTGRLQYSSSGSAGPRFFLLPHSAGFVDPLYSQGLVSTLESVYALALTLRDALEDDDLTAARFAGVERLQLTQLAAADRLVRNGYLAMRDFATWNAWTHLWMATKLFGDIFITRTCLRSIDANDPTVLDEAIAHVPATVHGPAAPEYQRLLGLAERQLEAAASGPTTPGPAAAAILSELDASRWLPHSAYGWGDRASTHVDFTPARLARVLLWGKLAAPRPMRRGMFDFKVSTLAREELRRQRRNRRPSAVPTAEPVPV